MGGGKGRGGGEQGPGGEGTPPPAPWRPSRSGQWVKVKADVPPDVASRHEFGLPRLHRAGDWLVGIWVAEHAAAVPEVVLRHDGPIMREKTIRINVPACVRLVDVNGDDVMRLTPEGLKAGTIAPADVEEWAPLLDRAELPPGRRVAEDVKLLP